MGSIVVIERGIGFDRTVGYMRACSILISVF